MTGVHMTYTAVRYHLIEAILSDADGQWTIDEMTKIISAKVGVPVGAVQDSLYSMMADNLLEPVPFQADLTLRLRHDMARPQSPLAGATERLARLLAAWREKHDPAAHHLPDLGEGR